MKKYLIVALIVLPLPLYLFGTVVLDIPGPVDLIATGDCNIMDMGEVCSDSVRREINILGATVLGVILDWRWFARASSSSADCSATVHSQGLGSSLIALVDKIRL